MPKPWGVAALFAEYTGNHAPIDIRWNVEPEIAQERPASDAAEEPLVQDPVVARQNRISRHRFRASGILRWR